jgi:Protein of unknown function (DUF2442)/Helix-turn-helix domain
MGSPQPKELSVETAAPNIRAIRADDAYHLVVTWKGGSECIINVDGLILDYAVFEPLRHNELSFSQVEVGEWGWSAHWSDDMEISSDTLWRLALQQGSAWLRTWRNDRGMTQGEAAVALGVSPRMWRYYEAGSHLLPKTVRLACIGLDAQAKAA